MIRAVIVMNDQGKHRLVKFYDYQTAEKQQEIIRRIYGVLCSRPENVSNFIQADSVFGPDARLVYKIYATLYVVFVFDASENELAILDLMQDMDSCLDRVSCRFKLREAEARRFMQFKPKNYCTLFVETLDKCFSNVRELDIVFSFNKVHSILDEIILGGQVLETSSSDVLQAVEEMSWLEKNSNSIIRVPKSISGWQGR